MQSLVVQVRLVMDHQDVQAMQTVLLPAQLH